jgi:glyoxylase I family protein
MIIGIEHTAIASPGPERLAQWYVDTLGFMINYRSASGSALFLKAPDGSMIEVIEAAGPASGSIGMNDPGLRHLAFKVADFPDACRQLRERGVAFLGEPCTRAGNSVVFFLDPDGNILHLLHRQTPLP